MTTSSPADTRGFLCEVNGGYSALSYGSKTSENELPVWVINHEVTREPNQPTGKSWSGIREWTHEGLV
jgi:hypothetical protein